MRRVLGVALLLAMAVSGSAHAQAPAKTKGEDKGQPVTVDADRMERYGKESLVVFTGNVIARQNNSVQYADRMEVYLDEKGDRVLRTVSTGTDAGTTLAWTGHIGVRRFTSRHGGLYLNGRRFFARFERHLDRQCFVVVAVAMNRLDHGAG